jgi:arylsulfatase
VPNSTDNTLFIFTADNGPEALFSGETSLTVETAVHGSAGPLAGYALYRL